MKSSGMCCDCLHLEQSPLVSFHAFRKHQGINWHRGLILAVKHLLADRRLLLGRSGVPRDSTGGLINQSRESCSLTPRKDAFWFDACYKYKS